MAKPIEELSQKNHGTTRGTSFIYIIIDLQAATRF